MGLCGKAAVRRAARGSGGALSPVFVTPAVVVDEHTVRFQARGCVLQVAALMLVLWGF